MKFAEPPLSNPLVFIDLITAAGSC
jgi:hypothetical protein